MAKIKGWKRIASSRNGQVREEIYETYAQKGKKRGASLASRTVQIFGDNKTASLYILKAVPAPREGYYINDFIVKRDNIEGNAMINYTVAKDAAVKYMKANP